MKKTLTMVLVCAVAFVFSFGAFCPEEAYAATVKMNKTSVVLYLDDDSANTVSLKVLNGSGKATWSTNLSKVVKIKSTGKRSAKVTALKQGRVTVTAKLGKKSYKCTVTVMKSNDDYSALLSKAAKAVMTYKYKDLMELAPKDELIKWIDSLGEDARRIIIKDQGGEDKYWRTAENFYLATVGTEYATTAEGATKGFFYTTGFGVPTTADKGNYRVVSEKSYKSVYGEAKFESLKTAYAKNLGLEIQDAKIIKCTSNYKISYGGGDYEKGSFSSTFTIFKAGDKWYFAPYNLKKLTTWQETYENLTAADTLYITADSTEINLSEREYVTLTVHEGKYAGTFDIIYDTSGEYSMAGCNNVYCEWGEWIDENSIELYIYPIDSSAYGDVAIRNSVNDDVLLIRVSYE